MTTWDICRILRNKNKLGWDNEKVKDIFYGIGRIDPFPSCYKYVGKIEKVWRSAFAVTPEVDFKKGSKLAVENKIEFIELKADSISIAPAIPNVAETRTGPIALGRICLETIRHEETPKA